MLVDDSLVIDPEPQFFWGMFGSCLVLRNGNSPCKDGSGSSLHLNQDMVSEGGASQVVAQTCANNNEMN